jgi:GTP-binding protein Era
MANFKSGFVAIIGRPNAGKSTLLNALVGSKISIVSPVPQTTRHQIRGILNLKETQIVFVDTPGVHSFSDPLTSHLNGLASHSLEGCDLIIYVADVTRIPGPEEREVIKILLRQDTKVIMALNKTDLNTKYLNEYITLWQSEAESKKTKDFLLFYLPISAASGKNVDELLSVVIENLPEQPAFYDTDTQTDFPLTYRVADCVREKLFLQLQEELPHSIAVEVENIEDTKTKSGKPIANIIVNIYVNRDSQKRIIIGAKGEMLKSVGSQATGDLEKMLNKKVFLQLWVKVMDDWQNKPRILKELGYWWA